MARLIIIVEGVALGAIESNKSRAVSFAYDPAWLARADAIVLSTSMPLAEAV